MTMLEDDPELLKYVKSLLIKDKELVSDLPLDDIDELIDMHYDEFCEVRSKSIPNITEDQQDRRLDIISKIIDLHKWAVIHRDARQNSWAKGVSITEVGLKQEPQSESEEAEDDEEKTRVQILAELIIQENNFVTTTDNEQLYWFNGKIYIPDQEWIIKRKCRLLEATSHDIQEVIDYIKDSTYIDRSQFDSNPDLLVVENGILNIHTLDLTAHTPEHYALSFLPVRYDKEARCSEFTKFLKDVLQRKYVKTMLKIICYCLYKSTKFEKAALFVGKGDNGKSTLLNALDKFFGSNNISHVSLQDLSGGNRFAAADLYGKMINTFADLKKDKLQDTGPFKMHVSGDWIRAEHKYMRPFGFQNHAKLFFSCNSIPESEDQGYAYYKRWIIFHFERSFIGEERDNTLIHKITTPEEHSGLLNLAVLSLKKLIEDEGLQT